MSMDHVCSMIPAYIFCCGIDTRFLYLPHVCGDDNAKRDRDADEQNADEDNERVVRM